MKIGIHGSSIGFAKQWVEYCKLNNIEHLVLDVTSKDFISELKSCDLFLWDYDLLLKKDNLVAKSVLNAVEYVGIKTFPDHHCRWHYDDKVAQKYLLELIDAPLIDTEVFYSIETALKWAETAQYPTVFKLKGGASSINVKLIKNKREAVKIIRKAFGKGFAPNNRLFYLKESLWKYRNGAISTFQFSKSIIRYFFPVRYLPVIDAPEKGYVYFQKFIPGNDHDIRLVVVNKERVFGLRRYNRPNDFRASGSGNFDYLGSNDISKELLTMVFDVTDKLKMDSVAYDIVFDNGEAKIIEVSYSYVSSAYNQCKGYWDRDGHWNESEMDYQGWIIERMLENV